MRSAAVLTAILATMGAPSAYAGERPAPAEAARPCPAWGPGFVKLPGSETCIRLKGRVRAEYGGSSGSRIRREDIEGFGASARVDLDARSQTEYGPLRTFVRVKGGRNASPN